MLRKAGDIQPYSVDEVNDFEWEIIRALEEFPQTVKRAADDLDPSVIAKYAIDLAQTFSSFYGNVKVLSDADHLSYRIALITSTAIVLKEALRLLGMKAPEEM